jgi:hypothetical protein
LKREKRGGKGGMGGKGFIKRGKINNKIILC